MKLLIADDEMRIRKGLYNLIKDRIEIELLEPAKNGLIALETIKEHHPDILLIDINMPKLNGLELIRQIKSMTPNAVTIIISGHDEFSYAKEAIDLGVDKYLLKPVNSEELITNIKAYMDEIKSRQASQSKEIFSHHTIEEHRDTVLSHLLSDWSKKNISKDQIKTRLKHLDIKIEASISLKHIRKVIPLRHDTCDLSLITTQLVNALNEAQLESFLFGDNFIFINSSDHIKIDQTMNIQLKAIKKTSNCLLLIESLSVEKPLTNLSEAYQTLVNSEVQSQDLSDIVLDAVQIMEYGYSNSDLTLMSIADAINVSHEYLSRLFKKELNQSPKQYLINMRLTKANRLLKRGHTKIYEVADQTGFSSQHYFCRAFKKKYGLSPSDFMRGVK